MDNEGPRPMINFRKAVRRKNCTERFYEENERNTEQYIAEHDKVQLQNVKQHNLGFPRLNDELRKKKSLTRILTTIRSYELNKGFDPHCNECLKLAAYNKLKNLNLRQRCTPSNRRKRNKSHHCFVNKISKSSKCIKKWVSKSCQCMKVDKHDKYTTCDNDLNFTTTNSACLKALKTDSRSGCRRMNNRHPSMSSYNSFASQGHEPLEQ